MPIPFSRGILIWKGYRTWRLSADLQRAQFTAPRVAETLAPQPPLDVVDLPVLLLLTAEPTPYHTLIRLFFLEQPVLETDLREALFRPWRWNRCSIAVFCEGPREGVRAMVKLLPHDQFYFVSDFPRRQSHESMPFDHVLGVGGTSSTLAGLTPRHPVKSCLEPCAGGGVQSILASPFASRVVGTDMNERALNFARFNAHLNGIHNIEWRQGSFFEPVAAEQFDLLVANPPFVISPESSLLYRDGGGKATGFPNRSCAASRNTWPKAALASCSSTGITPMIPIGMSVLCNGLRTMVVIAG